MGSSDKISQYVHECKVLNIEVLPPDINESQMKFTVVNGKIRFGLAAVKNVGEGAVKSVIDERRTDGNYRSFRDFCDRIDGKDVNKRCIESLIKSGAFDSMGVYRSRLIAVFEKMLDGIAQIKKRNMEGQLSLFELSMGTDDKVNSSETSFYEDEDIYPDINEYPNKVLLSMEKEMLGLYISGHPLSEFEEELNKMVSLFSSELNVDANQSEEAYSLDDAKNISDGMNVIVGGIITSKKTKTTRNNNLMAFLTLEDLYGMMEVIVFPTVLEKYSKLIVEENIVLIKGRISIKEEEQPKIICEEINPLKKMQVQKVYLRVSHNIEDDKRDSLMALLKYFNGDTPVCLCDDVEKKGRVLEKECWIALNESIIAELKQRLGEENVKVV